ncbi:uncharacterized protein LOC143177662 [Calliopsis andreniformis]|uniref:uncharacterized protein LOC143177662 n=1 Tax=Calliopsis andreniformis TaxID=337506 RepID=UPI003FCE0E9D
MGNYVTKYFSHNDDTEKVETNGQSSTDETTVENDIMHTPPVVSKTLTIDPRSVTTGIDRTPIEVNFTPVGLNKRIISAIPKHLQMKPYLETDIDKVIFCLSPKKCTPKLTETTQLQLVDVQNTNVQDSTVNSEKRISLIQKERYKILGLDPRSPAADFDRTPILKPKSLQRLKARHLQSMHNYGSYDTDASSTTFSYCEMSSQFNVPEIQVLPDLATCTIKPLGLDNSNFVDNLNESDSTCSSHSPRTEIISNNGEKQLKNKNDKTSSESTTSTVCITKDKHKETRVNDNDTIKVWRDSLISNCPEELESIESIDEQIVEENIPQLPKEEKIESNGKKKRVLKPEAKVVPDEKKIFYANDKNCGIESTKIRTPLGNRSNNGQIQTALTKSPQQVFKNKNIISKISQENTPPHKKCIVKSRLGNTQWDPDSTVII